jgi:hyaluronoglucosaminidase
MMHGIIEGFYGTPWSWQERQDVATALARAGMDTYVYAPKDDPLHRERWREPYPAVELDGFASLVGSGTLRVGVALSPGLSMDPESPEDRSQLLAKVDQLLGTGVTLIGMLFDDLDPQPGLGTRHGAVTAWLREQLADEVELFMVPLHYTGTTSVPYLEDLLAELPERVPVGWTGRYVVNESIAAGDAR